VVNSLKKYLDMKSLLFIFVAFIAITSTLSGLMMISDPNGGALNLSLTLLEGTAFRNFLLPGVLLVTIVGGVNLAALFYSFENSPSRYNWAIAGGLLIIGWIIAQMIIIQSVHWLHFIYMGIGFMIILMAYQLKGRWVV
jgi:hypothetical protein